MAQKHCKIWLVWLITALVGTAWHFLYTWLPNPLVGLIAPINESVWEHLKLLFWPFLLACPWLARQGRDPQRAWGACFAALLWMPVLLLGVYYPLKAGFDVQSEAMPILLYYLVLAAGFYLARRLSHSAAIGRNAGVLLMLVGCYAACLVIFSVAAPMLPIFMSP
jgi:hypothetical protein